MENQTLFIAKGICKAFGPTRALIDVNIEVKRGEIRGLIGENGSGKSTFSGLVAGALMKDGGIFEFKGQSYCPRNMVDAQNHGISMIVQERGTISGISVASNIFTGRLEEFTRMGIFSNKAMNRKADKILQDIGATDIKGEMMIDLLDFEQRKIVEIARAMVNDPEILIIDETTTALAEKGRRLLYNLIDRIHQQNKAVIFISHDLDELMTVCNTVTVLRDGCVIETLDKQQMNVNRMRELMIGRKLTGHYFREDFDGSFSTEIVLKADNITSDVIEQISLELHKGEILGIGGLSESGMHELGQVLFGIKKPITGRVILTRNGFRVSNPIKAVKNKMAYVSKDRDKEAIILVASIKDNIAIPSLGLLSNVFGYISPKVEAKLACEQIETMSIKCRNEKQTCIDLSGGNKQKVVFSKWLAQKSDILILDCPTRGIDVGVKAAMYQLLTQLKMQGKSIIMISEELLELIGMSDRILVMKNGKINAEFARNQNLSEKEIIHHMI